MERGRKIQLNMSEEKIKDLLSHRASLGATHFSSTPLGGLKPTKPSTPEDFRESLERTILYDFSDVKRKKAYFTASIVGGDIIRIDYYNSRDYRSQSYSNPGEWAETSTDEMKGIAIKVLSEDLGIKYRG